MGIRPIQDTLAAIRDGAMMDDLSADFNDLIRQIRLTDKKGTITIKLTIDPVQHDSSMVTIKDDITINAPKVDKPPSLFYTTVDANVQRKNPDQPDLNGLVDVSSGSGESIDLWTDGDEKKPAKEAK